MNDRPLQVLLVEDNAGDARLLREMFSKESAESFCLTHLLRMREAEIHLARGGVDILLLDMGLPDGHGLDTVRRAHLAAPNVPMIVLTGLDDEMLAAEAMKEGAQDYLIKGQIENRALPRALRYAIERHRMQEVTESIQMQQMNLKNEFLSHVSHELRSPLTSIYSFTSIITDGLAGETTEQQDEYLKIILRNVRQLKAMIEDLLEVTRAQTGKLSVDLQRVSILDALTYAVDTFQGAAAAKEISVRCEFPVVLPFAIADPIRLRQVLSILIDNAIKFTPGGGVVEIGAAEAAGDPGVFMVTVKDSGYGIDPEMTDRIFEHLYQVDGSSRAGREGLGLGLHIAKELISRMDGRIWVESELRKGSRFCFTLPLFSLRNIVESMLMTEKKADEGIVVLRIEIKAENGSRIVAPEIAIVARILLQECLRPDTDVLLPPIEATSEHKVFLVLACTHEEGAAVIGTRILRHFQRHELLQPADCTFAITHHFFDSLSKEPCETVEGSVSRIVLGIEAYIDAAMPRGTV